MKYTAEMILRSDSGYAMPFEETKGKDVEMTLPYGKQTHPDTGEEFFHDGTDFNANHYLLASVATGTVIATGEERQRGIFITMRYGKYEVTYRHLSNVFVSFGQNIRAGQTVAVSGDMLHIETSFDGQPLDPIEFLTMIYSDIRAMEADGDVLNNASANGFDMNVPSPYDNDREEIETLMLRFLPDYFNALQCGTYSVPLHTEQSLRNIFSLAGAKNYFFETMPNMGNPLGIGQRCMPLAAKVQNLLIGDFLNYPGLHHQVYLSSMNEILKKNSGSKP